MSAGIVSVGVILCVFSYQYSWLCSDWFDARQRKNGFVFTKCRQESRRTTLHLMVPQRTK